MRFRTICLITLLLTGCAAPPSGASSQIPVPGSETTGSVAVATPASGSASATATTPSASTPTVSQSTPIAGSSPTPVSTAVPPTTIPTGAPTTVSTSLPSARPAQATATTSSAASAASVLAPTELKYRLIQQYGIFYCASGSPPTYDDETDRAAQSFPAIQKDSEIFRAILEHNQLSGVASFSAQQKLLVYRDYQKLSMVKVEVAGGQYTFSLRTTERLAGVVLIGAITAQGTSTVTNRQPIVNRCAS